MAMDSVLTTLEERIEALVEAYHEATRRAEDATARAERLAARVAELEEEASGQDDLSQQIQALENERDQLTARLEKVVGVLDAALEKHGTSTGDTG